MTKVIFGKNKRFYLKKIIKKSNNILIISSKRGKKRFINENKFNLKKNCKIDWIDHISSNPDLSKINKIFKSFERTNYDFIVGIGGGSVLDVSKIIKLHFINEKLNNKIELICIPTTAGTGSEVTQFSTIWDFKLKKKISIEDLKMKPNYAIVDPILSYTVPKEITFSTGLDALNQCFDSLWNKNSKSIVKNLSINSIVTIFKGLKKISKNINDKEARDLLSFGSLKSGECISKTKTSICHSISYPLTLNFGIDHGYACAFSMLAVINLVNRKNPIFFNKLINKLKMKNFDEFFGSINDLLKVLNVNHYCIKKIKKYNKLEKVIPQMFNRKRLNNFIYVSNINRKRLISILNCSFNENHKNFKFNI